MANDISNNLNSQLNSARNILLYTTQPDAKHFSHLNIQERVFLAVELMFRHLPPNTNLSQLSNNEIYNGFMLARGLVSSNENTADIRNLVSFRSDVLPVNFSATALRDLGQLVKVLVTDASNAKTTANLDLAVQKFIRILVATNELGVLLAAAALAKQAELGTISANRTLALVQIYQLISRLIQAGEAAMKEAAAKNGLAKNEFVGINLNKMASAEEKNALLRDLQTNNLHTNLKNFLNSIRHSSPNARLLRSSTRTTHATRNSILRVITRTRSNNGSTAEIIALSKRLIWKNPSASSSNAAWKIFSRLQKRGSFLSATVRRRAGISSNRFW